MSSIKLAGVNESYIQMFRKLRPGAKVKVTRARNKGRLKLGQVYEFIKFTESPAYGYYLFIQGSNYKIHSDKEDGYLFAIVGRPEYISCNPKNSPEDV